MLNSHHQGKLLIAANVTANQNGNAFEVLSVAEPFGFGLVARDNGGTTPTLDVDIETSMDGGTTWTVLDSFTQVTTTDTSEIISPSPLPPAALIRAAVTVGGTPDYDVEVFSLGAIQVRLNGLV